MVQGHEWCLSLRMGMDTLRLIDEMNAIVKARDFPEDLLIKFNPEYYIMRNFPTLCCTKGRHGWSFFRTGEVATEKQQVEVGFDLMVDTRVLPEVNHLLGSFVRLYMDGASFYMSTQSGSHRWVTWDHKNFALLWGEGIP